MSSFANYRDRIACGAPLFLGSGTVEDLNDLLNEAVALHEGFCTVCPTFINLKKASESGHFPAVEDCGWCSEEAEDYDSEAGFWMAPAHLKWIQAAETVREAGVSVGNLVNVQEVTF